MIQAKTTRLRLELTADSPQRFAQAYLAHHFTLAPSRMHDDLFKYLGRMSTVRGCRIAIAAPRGHAKTTVVGLAGVLWSALFEKEKFIMIVSATKQQAERILRDIRDEIQTNPLLHRDFPAVCFPPDQSRYPKPWRDNEIMLTNGVTIKAVGAHQAIRGTKRRQHRPTLIIVDDLEDRAQVQSAEQREKLRDWFDRTLLKAGEPRTNIIVVGTILHYDSLLANLTHPDKTPGRGAGWESCVYRAVEKFSERMDLWDLWEEIMFGDGEFKGETGQEAIKLLFNHHRCKMWLGTKVLWPQLDSFVQLMWMRAVEGRAAFQSEKQNEPLDPEQCLFKESSFRYWDDVKDPKFEDVDDLIYKLGRNVRIYGACDPSMGKRPGRGDYSAIISIAKDKRTDRLYVIGADIARRTPDETIDRIVQLSKMYDYEELAVESNQFQELMADQLEERLRRHGNYISI